jgi:cytoskeletal protein CcmA (bactofilin family)
MWSKPQTPTQTEGAAQTELPAAQASKTTSFQPSDIALGALRAPRPAEPATHPPSPTYLGSGVHISGLMECSEDLQIDGKMEGPVSLKGYTLTVGSTATLRSDVTAGGIIVHGKIIGNIFATDRVEIRTEGCVIGDISTSRISIEDGAHFKGRIEIDPAKFLASKR